MSSAAEVGADFVKLSARGRTYVGKVVTRYGILLHNAVRSHAQEPRTAVRPGSPGEGPRHLTGGYLRSIGRRTVHTATTSTASVGSNDDRARRLQLGFTGTDSLGRSFDQQAYPHYDKGLDDVSKGFQAAMAATPGATAR